jgi:eukaryotic-like serine/threonine-protein kinase
MIPSVADLVGLLRDSRLLDPSQLEGLTQRLNQRSQEPSALARELVERGWLTPYQMNQVVLGRGGDLVLGSYVLLERLGKGGMGQVYKARHRRMDRMVALKVIRKELLANPTAVALFHREILAAARLAHPNIVLAYDADAVDGVHFYTMEYVEGTTLARLVKGSGPLPVPLACESMRQAALGMQHAFERGLVHRDINPGNLMLTWTSLPGSPPVARVVEERIYELWGTHTPLVKILDMGLARFQHPVTDSGLSQVGPVSDVVAGTPDFTAPEQGRDARRADIRSDLYSLGCTFYYVLTGQVPFPKGTRMEKLLRHQQEEPRPIADLQPQVPATVQRMVSRLMAKRPEQRFQTPAELGAELDAGAG